MRKSPQEETLRVMLEGDAVRQVLEIVIPIKDPKK